jgi:hypothetical protein
LNNVFFALFYSVPSLIILFSITSYSSKFFSVLISVWILFYFEMLNLELANQEFYPYSVSSPSTLLLKSFISNFQNNSFLMLSTLRIVDSITWFVLIWFCSLAFNLEFNLFGVLGFQYLFCKLRFAFLNLNIIKIYILNYTFYWAFTFYLINFYFIIGFTLTFDYKFVFLQYS